MGAKKLGCCYKNRSLNACCCQLGPQEGPEAHFGPILVPLGFIRSPILAPDPYFCHTHPRYLFKNRVKTREGCVTERSVTHPSRAKTLFLKKNRLGAAKRGPEQQKGVRLRVNPPHKLTPIYCHASTRIGA